jgi:hypothetical protein
MSKEKLVFALRLLKNELGLNDASDRIIFLPVGTKLINVYVVLSEFSKEAHGKHLTFPLAAGVTPCQIEIQFSLDSFRLSH